VRNSAVVKPDEGGERDQEHVERIDEELLPQQVRQHDHKHVGWIGDELLPQPNDRSAGNDSGREQNGGEEGREAHRRVQLGRPAAVAGEGEQQRAE